MKLRYFGHSCFSLTFSDGTILVTDPFDPTVTFPPCNISCSGALVSHNHFDHNYTAGLLGDFKVISAAGSYEIGVQKITAIPSFHDPKEGALRGENLLMRIEGDGLSIAHLGDLGHPLDDTQAEALKDLDVLMLPIGGTYTIDTPQAEELIRRIKPRRVIAMHFRTEAFEINITTCDAFAADMSAAFLPNEIEITRENLETLPEVMIMNYK